MSLHRFILSSMLWLLLVSQALAQRVANPYDHEFAGRWYVTVVYGQPTTLADTQLRQLMATDLRWRDLQTRVIFTEWEAGSNWMTKSNWGYYLSAGVKPCIVVQGPHRKDGTAPVIYHATAGTVAFDNALFDRVAQVANLYASTNAPSTLEQCPFQPRTPAPAPRPAAPMPAPLVPLAPTPAAPIEENYIPLIFFLAPFAGAALGARAYLKEGR